MKLYLVRHGESEANRQNKLSLPTVELTENGRRDAENAGALLRSVSFDRVFVSPYTRALQTQKIALPEVEGEVVDCLHECDCGRLEGMSYAEAETTYGEYFRQCCVVDDFKAFGGEDYANMRRRVREFMALAVASNCETIAAFAHAGVILAFFDEVMQRDGKPGRHVHCDNGSVNIFEYHKETNLWSLKAWNITGRI